MSTIPLYSDSLALLTDLYQLTMAYGYWSAGMAQREAVFHLFFRRNPFGGEFAVACGLAGVIDYLERYRFDQEDLDYLAGLTGGDRQPLFEDGFLHDLKSLRLACDIHAVPEGTVVFPHEPLVRVQGPLMQCQLLETALLNQINFSTLVATKAARVCLAAEGDPVVDFGLRRAQGIDGGMTASRAAFVGGCESTSNVLAGKRFGLPVRGTHAHSWVMSFDSELESFEAYADALPANCVFLADTYDTLQGVRHAVTVGQRLKQQGHRMLGIRLDSGDLAELSIAARRILNEGGLPDAKIVASNDLDENRIADLKRRGAKIDIWGVGTRLVTAYDEPALGGVYKLAALQSEDGVWQYKVKLSEEPGKSTIPGIQQVRRFYDESGFLGDVIYDEPRGIVGPVQAVDLQDGRPMTVAEDASFIDMLEPICRAGRLVYRSLDITQIRERTIDQLQRLPASVTRRESPSAYPVGLERGLSELRAILTAQAAEG